MKFWQIAAAVLIFKLLDLCLVVGATVAPGSPPIVIYLIALIIWLLLSAAAWATLRELEALVVRHRQDSQ
jgi:hypothetical protein